MRSDQAKALLDNPVYQESFDAIKEQMVHKIETGRITPEERDNACTVLWLLNNLKGYADNLINGEKVKEFNLKQKKRFFG